MPNRPAVVVFTLLLAAAFPGRAAVVERTDIDEMARSADLVVIGTVGTRSCRYEGSPGARRIVTDVVVKVSRNIRGSAGAAGEVIVTVPGGVVDGRGQLVPGAPRMVAGEEVFLFLRTRAGAEGGGIHATVVGLAQGLFGVDRNAHGKARARQRLDGMTLVPAGKTAGVEMDLDDLVRAVESAGKGR